MTGLSVADLELLWAGHDKQWRDPTLALNPWFGAQIDPRLLRARSTGAWWETLDRLGVTLLVTREYEHLVMALTVSEERPRVSYLPLPHPSGLAVDRRRSLVAVASTRNPNQIYDLRPVTSTLDRGDVQPPDVSHRPLLPIRSTIQPGRSTSMTWPT